MMVSVETYLRRGQRTIQRWVMAPEVRTMFSIFAHAGGGFLLSAASLGSLCQPLAMGLICGATGWRALLITLGAMVGYPFFWGIAGTQGIVWAAVGGILTLTLGKRQESRDMPWMLPCLAAFFTAVTGLAFRFLLGDNTPVKMYFLRIALSGLSAVLFTQVLYSRDVIADWLACGVAVLALAQVAPLPRLGLGYLAAGMLGVGAAFPAAAMAGLGLDLARVTRLPMTAVMCMSYFLGMIPFKFRWQRYAVPGLACLITMAACNIWDLRPPLGLFLGGALGVFLPKKPEVARRRGSTGVAQVRLELGAEVMTRVQHILADTAPLPVDQEALLDKVRHRACNTCSARKNCTDQAKLTVELLQNPMDGDCRKSGRLIPELHRGQDQLRIMQADQKRRREYRDALMQQYRFLGEYLRTLADELPRKSSREEISFRAEVSARSKGKARSNGDRCLAFAGSTGSYFVVLCDGMGTGLGAAHEGQTTAEFLRQMLCAGFPPEHALCTVNSLMTLQGHGGAATVDLAQLHLDTGLAQIYKWGAAPSWVLRRDGTEKIGTANPPPGLSVQEMPVAAEKLSLRRGEVLILLSDGVDGEGVLRHCQYTPDAPPGELAADILEKGRGSGEDDATVAVIRLRPTGMAAS